MTLSSFSLANKVAVVTGGYGILGSAIARGLLEAGASVCILGRDRTSAASMVSDIAPLAVDNAVAGFKIADVTSESDLHAARDAILSDFGRIDILVNAAGGNVATARTDGMPPFRMELGPFDEVIKLNLHGTVYPSLIFGESMAEQGKGSIINISSMASTRAISGVAGYSAAKAAVDNFTRWMAVDLARQYGSDIRVNALAPGFFVTRQNKDVLIQPDGSYTDRSKSILKMTPAGRFGGPEELIGPVVWLCSDAASFVTGTVIPVDGGFSAFSGI